MILEKPQSKVIPTDYHWGMIHWDPINPYLYTVSKLAYSVFEDEC